MIRKINAFDFERIYCLGNNYDPFFYRQYNLENYINNDLYIMNCYVEEDIIKGFIIANKIYENIEILLVYVDKEYRNKGIASALIHRLEEKDVDNLLLEVSVENISALNLYKSLGFNIINIRKKYYKGIDAYVMKKVLK